MSGVHPGGHGATNANSGLNNESIENAFEMDGDVRSALREGGASGQEIKEIKEMADELTAMKDEFMADGNLSEEESAQLGEEAAAMDELVHSSVDMSQLSKEQQMALTEFCGACFEDMAGKATDKAVANEEMEAT